MLLFLTLPVAPHVLGITLAPRFIALHFRLSDSSCVPLTVRCAIASSSSNAGDAQKVAETTSPQCGYPKCDDYTGNGQTHKVQVSGASSVWHWSRAESSTIDSVRKTLTVFDDEFNVRRHISWRLSLIFCVNIYVYIRHLPLDPSLFPQELRFQPSTNFEMSFLASGGLLRMKAESPWRHIRSCVFVVTCCCISRHLERRTFA